MKTAISIPDDLFREAEQLARRERRSRSDLYARAVAEYLNRHSPDRITEAMDAALVELEGEVDPFPVAAGRRTLSRSEW